MLHLCKALSDALAQMVLDVQPCFAYTFLLMVYILLVWFRPFRSNSLSIAVGSYSKQETIRLRSESCQQYRMILWLVHSVSVVKRDVNSAGFHSCRCCFSNGITKAKTFIRAFPLPEWILKTNASFCSNSDWSKESQQHANRVGSVVTTTSRGDGGQL